MRCYTNTAPAPRAIRRALLAALTLSALTAQAIVPRGDNAAQPSAPAADAYANQLSTRTYSNIDEALSAATWN